LALLLLNLWVTLFLVSRTALQHSMLPFLGAAAGFGLDELARRRIPPLLIVGIGW